MRFSSSSVCITCLQSESFGAVQRAIGTAMRLTARVQLQQSAGCAQLRSCSNSLDDRSLWQSAGCNCRGQDGLPPEERRRQALAVLTSGWPAGSAEGAAFDTAHVLQLCHAHAFKDGLLFLFERMQAHTRQLQVCLSSVLYALQVGGGWHVHIQCYRTVHMRCGCDSQTILPCWRRDVYGRQCALYRLQQRQDTVCSVRRRC